MAARGAGGIVVDWNKALSRAIGEELRRAREACGLSRGQLVARLPSGIGDRTLLSYEHGTRNPTVVRFVEVAGALGVSPAVLVTLACQRARADLDNLSLWVDLRAIVADKTSAFVSLVMWAHNKLIHHPGGVVEVAPAGVEELAAVVGCSRLELVSYLTRFTPDMDDVLDVDDSRELVPQ
jgi:transcriptional regulator with XRE-family HTH domain